MKILITGCNGQLGRCLVELLPLFPQVEATGIDIDSLDITDEKATKRFVEANRFDVIVNCAAYTNVDKAEAEEDKAQAINADAVRNLAEACRNAGSKLIHISTDYVFAGDKTIPYRETDPTGPTTAYGRSKLKGEELIAEMLPEAIIIRTAWLYSLYGHNFFLTMRQKAKEGAKVRVVNDQKGCPTFAGDLATAILQIITAGHWEPGIYHFTGRGATTWYDFTREIYRLCGADTGKVVPVTSEEYRTAARRPAYSVLDTAKIKETYNVNVPDWKSSLEKVANSNGNK